MYQSVTVSKNKSVSCFPKALLPCSLFILFLSFRITPPFFHRCATFNFKQLYIILYIIVLKRCFIIYYFFISFFILLLLLLYYFYTEEKWYFIIIKNNNIIISKSIQYHYIIILLFLSYFLRLHFVQFYIVSILIPRKKPCILFLYDTNYFEPPHPYQPHHTFHPPSYIVILHLYS